MRRIISGVTAGHDRRHNADEEEEEDDDGGGKNAAGLSSSIVFPDNDRDEEWQYISKREEREGGISPLNIYA